MTDDLGVARGADLQAFGEPGQRTFQLRVSGANDQSASLWLEKEHLQALALAFQQLLAEIKYKDEPRAIRLSDFPDAAQHDFKVGRIGMGFRQPDQTVVLQVDETAEEGDDFRLRFQLTLEHCASLSVQLGEIIAGGRPICPLCALPIEAEGHACVRANGHLKLPIPEEDSGDEDAE
ncbi:MAG: DUF3090 family protein [Dehalococcoidia bacterium]